MYVSKINDIMFFWCLSELEKYDLTAFRLIKYHCTKNYFSKHKSSYLKNRSKCVCVCVCVWSLFWNKAFNDRVYFRFTCGDFWFCSLRVAGLCNFLKLYRGFLNCMSKVRDRVVLCASIYTSLCIVYFLPCIWVRTANLRTVPFSSLYFSLTIWR